MNLVEKVKTYAKKFKEFSPEIMEGVELCYKYSPTFRAHVDSPHFGEVRGWRVTWMFTPHVKQYAMLKYVGPYDLGLFSVRIDGILGKTNIEAFVKEAKDLPITREYITSTADFICELIRNGEVEWLQGNPNADIKPALKLCSQYSPTFNAVQTMGKGNGWEIVKLWVDNPERITALRRIFPLDIAIYCVRLDSIIHGINLTDFGKEAEEIPAFKLFPIEVARFTLQVLSNRYREQ